MNDSFFFSESFFNFIHWPGDIDNFLVVLRRLYLRGRSKWLLLGGGGGLWFRAMRTLMWMSLKRELEQAGQNEAVCEWKILWDSGEASGLTVKKSETEDAGRENMNGLVWKEGPLMGVDQKWVHQGGPGGWWVLGARWVNNGYGSSAIWWDEMRST